MAHTSDIEILKYNLPLQVFFSVSFLPLQSSRQFSGNEHEKNRKQSLTSKEKNIHNKQNYFQFHCQV